MRTLGILALSALLGACHVSPEGNPATYVPPPTGNEGSPRPTPAQIAQDLPRAAAPLEVGARAPAFHLQTATQTVESSNALRSGPLVLVFYIGDYCMFCRQQLTALQAHLGEFQAAGATVWAVSVDPVSTSAALATALHVSFPLPSDPDLHVVRAFGVETAGDAHVALPSVFVLAPDGAGGRVAYRHVGANQADRAGVDTLLQAVRSITRDQ